MILDPTGRAQRTWWSREWGRTPRLVRLMSIMEVVAGGGLRAIRGSVFSRMEYYSTIWRKPLPRLIPTFSLKYYQTEAWSLFQYLATLTEEVSPLLLELLSWRSVISRNLQRLRIEVKEGIHYQYELQTNSETVMGCQAHRGKRQAHVCSLFRPVPRGNKIPLKAHFFIQAKLPFCLYPQRGEPGQDVLPE